MNDSKDATEKWRENLFEETFDRTFMELTRQGEMHSGLPITEIEARLNDRYLRYGHGWDGGSPVQEVMLSAEIAALEAVLAQWRGELSPLKRI
ncbi:hypothetical protein OOT00_06645 [Desulfobotulus sp. H1]|uniref:Uncharacterized protein n=1 Tax=Desulfobotulus pelophilus TaxID=2823377 RepID=A0ABT3N8Z1_9BACT|nr:hypothetical protein [Desulfobotulus pelophilus]MCW7753661.1 hypothetical protein [Desulfobotulus pelophilus]